MSSVSLSGISSSTSNQPSYQPIQPIRGTIISMNSVLEEQFAFLRPINDINFACLNYQR